MDDMSIEPSTAARRTASPRPPQRREIPDWVWLVVGLLILALAFGIGYPMVNAKKKLAAQETPLSTMTTVSPTPSSPSTSLASPAVMKPATDKDIMAVTLPTSAGEYTLTGAVQFTYENTREKATYSGPLGVLTVYRTVGGSEGATTAMSDRQDYPNYRCGIVTGQRYCLTLATGGYLWVAVPNNAASQQALPEFMGAFASQL